MTLISTPLAPRILDPAEPPAALERPAPDAPHVWLARTAAPSARVLAEGPALFDAEERRRADAFARPALRERYVVAHVALRRLLGAYLDRHPRDIAFTREPCPLCAKPHGRPAVAADGGAPRVHFSLSHSDDLAVLAFAPVPVGADVERFPRLSTADEVAGSLHPRERAELAALPPERRPEAFARVWARKEAHLKGTGAGVGGGLDGYYLGVGPTPVHPPGWLLADVAVDPGYAACVAVTRSG
ncbi:hypothetical protein GCM10027168_22760 [Streptomyces capparidis]